MSQWKLALQKEFSSRYQEANPTILVISQDLTKTKRKENQQGTEQHELMKAEMQKIYDQAINEPVDDEENNTDVK